MANSKCIKYLAQGSSAWNSWRIKKSGNGYDLSDLNFFDDIKPSNYGFDLPDYRGYDFTNCNLNRVSLRNCNFIDCDFSGSNLHFSDLVDSYFVNCNFTNAQLQVTKIGSAHFIGCNFHSANLSYCSAEETDFTGSKLIDTNLSHMSLVKTDFTNTIIKGVCVYGISAWDLILEGAKQETIYISDSDISITVPTIELAQFISLLVNNSKIRDVIDTITSKVVLILGRFTKERKVILDSIKNELQLRGYLPVLFDFEGPTNRDITETVMTLASLSKFVIADLSSPKSIPQELTTIIPNFPSVPVQPIILVSEREYSMFEHFNKYPWVLEKITYEQELVPKLVNDIVANYKKYTKT